MFKNIFKTISRLSKAALSGLIQNSGIAALYLGSSLLLAGILLTAYLTYAWDITPDQWYRALAVLQGYDLANIRKAEQEGAAEASFRDTVERRAVLNREAEYNREVTQPMTSFTPPPRAPEPEPPPPPSATERIDAYRKRVADDLAQARSTGLAEQTRLIEEMDPEQAKEVIRKLWKDGQNRRVLTMLLDMTDENRAEILYTMQQDNEEELKDLTEILQRIGDGQPMSGVIEDAAAEN